MSVLQQILKHNQNFVDSGEYAQFITNKFPEKHIANLTCMDTRMVELLPKAMGLKNGDAKFIKNAGAVVTHPFGSVMRSLLIAVYELGVKEIFVIAHMDCGMRSINADAILAKARAAGISDESLETLTNAGINLNDWLKGFDNVEDSVRHTVNMIRKHPLIPPSVAIHGLVAHPTTGQLTIVVDDSALCPES